MKPKMKLSRSKIMLIVITSIPMILIISLTTILYSMTYFTNEFVSFLLNCVVLAGRLISNIQITDENWEQCTENLVQFKSRKHAYMFNDVTPLDFELTFVVIQHREVNGFKLYDVRPVDSPEAELITISIHNLIALP